MPVLEIKRAAPLTDIPGRLRHLAERIEGGHLAPDLALVVLRENDGLRFFGYGAYSSDDECRGIFLRAATDVGKN